MTVLFFSKKMHTHTHTRYKKVQVSVWKRSELIRSSAEYNDIVNGMGAALYDVSRGPENEYLE